MVQEQRILDNTVDFNGRPTARELITTIFSKLLLFELHLPLLLFIKRLLGVWWPEYQGHLQSNCCTLLEAQNK